MTPDEEANYTRWRHESADTKFKSFELLPVPQAVIRLPCGCTNGRGQEQLWVERDPKSPQRPAPLKCRRCQATLPAVPRRP